MRMFWMMLIVVFIYKVAKIFDFVQDITLIVLLIIIAIPIVGGIKKNT